MLTLIELSQVEKKRENYTLAGKGNMLSALLVWFRYNLAGFSNSNNDFSAFFSKCHYPYFDGPYTLFEID
jgi:hypothetical protein